MYRLTFQSRSLANFAAVLLLKLALLTLNLPRTAVSTIELLSKPQFIVGQHRKAFAKGSALLPMVKGSNSCCLESGKGIMESASSPIPRA